MTFLRLVVAFCFGALLVLWTYDRDAEKRVCFPSNYETRE